MKVERLMFSVSRRIGFPLKNSQSLIDDLLMADYVLRDHEGFGWILGAAGTAMLPPIGPYNSDVESMYMRTVYLGMMHTSPKSPSLPIYYFVARPNSLTQVTLADFCRFVCAPLIHKVRFSYYLDYMEPIKEETWKAKRYSFLVGPWRNTWGNGGDQHH